jgi:hypothetical protein
MVILITIIKESSPEKIPQWLYTFEITDKFIKHIDLYEYSSVTMLAEKIVQFSQT